MISKTVPLKSMKRVSISKFQDLLPKLRGRVFHVTTSDYYEKILVSEELIPSDLGHPSPFGNTLNGYFRLKGCVSLFDYRRYESPEWEEFYDRCLPTMPLKPETPIVILFLSPHFYEQLISWENWKTEQCWSQRVVPHVECGFPGGIPLSYIHDQLWITKK